MGDRESEREEEREQESIITRQHNLRIERLKDRKVNKQCITSSNREGEREGERANKGSESGVKARERESL